MSKVRIAYIASLIVLALLVISTIFRPMAVDEEYSEVQREHLLRTEDEWIVEFRIANHEGKNQDYAIVTLVDGEKYTEEVTIPHGRIFTYIRHVRDDINDDNVTFAIYKGQEIEPFKQATYYLK